MDLTLVPICNDQEHILDNKYRIREYYCSICYKEGINYQCINCDFSNDDAFNNFLQKVRSLEIEALVNNAGMYDFSKNQDLRFSENFYISRKGSRLKFVFAVPQRAGPRERREILSTVFLKF